MGYSNWSDDFYQDKVDAKVSTGTPTFAYDADIKSGRVASKVHDTLNVFGKIRESRDSADHPDSTAIAVIFDETGSMGQVPKVMQKKLPQLMSLLLRKGYIKDPQVLFGAVGDYPNNEKAPLQVGQFESGVEMDDAITNIYLEGNGGGQTMESYQDALYFFAHRTSIDCFEKRGKKGYLFIIGDEKPFPESPADELLTLLGKEASIAPNPACPNGFKHVIQGGATVKEIVRDVQEKYEVFFIIPNQSSYYDQAWLKETWSSLLGAERVIKLEDPEAVCETIGATIGLLEGALAADAIASDLKDVGAGHSIVKAVTAGLDGLAKSTALAKTGTGSLPEKTGRSTDTERL
jgi:hypothetical protein